MNYFLPILSVLAGFLFVLVFRPEKQKNLRLLLAFSGAFLLSLSVFSLLPEIYAAADNEQIGIFIILGVLLQLILEVFSKGAEHGHMHLHPYTNGFPWLVFTGLAIHAILEGLPIHRHEHLMYGIIIHKLPVAVVLSLLFLRSAMKRRTIVIFLLLFSLMTPAGMLLSEYLHFLERYSRQVLALVVGIFLHISTIIMFESSEGHQFNGSKFIAILTGIAAAYFL